MQILVKLPIAVLLLALVAGCAGGGSVSSPGPETGLLLDQLQSQAADARQAAAARAGRAGPEAFVGVAALLESERPEVKKCAEQALFGAP